MNKQTAFETQAQILSQVFEFEPVAGAFAEGASNVPLFVPGRVAGEAMASPKARSMDNSEMLSDLPETLRVGLGVKLPSNSDNENAGLVVHCQQQRDMEGDIVNRIRDLSGEDVEVVFTGPAIVDPFAVSQAAALTPMPLKSGNSVGHFAITAGTIGAFVRVGDDQPFILSNNHVLANSNSGAINDVILSPGRADGGTSPSNDVATLEEFINIDFGGVIPNDVDAAVARIIDGISIDTDTLDFGPTGTASTIFSKTSNIIIEQDHVWKNGRTTGWTEGTVTSAGHGVTVAFDDGISVRHAYFVNQISIEGIGGHFSAGGDSGSMILNDDSQAVGLLFAGTPFGGEGGNGVTYANPMQVVLNRLGASFA